MPTIRPYKIIDDEYVSQTSYTIDLDLPTSGILSSLMLMVKAWTEADGLCSGPWINRLVSSVSVNQAGQAFLNAAPPEVFQADAYYKTGKMPRRGYHVAGSRAGEIIEEVPIHFGNKFNDLEHTIDLSKLSDPKLSVTYNQATTGILGETIWDTDYPPRFTVIAHLLQGAGLPASKGYHSLRQIESYTPTNSLKKKIELKGGRPIKRLYCQFDPTHPQYGWIHSLDQVKLWGDNESWVPFLMKCDDWQMLIRDHFGICTVEAQVEQVLNGVHIDTCVDRRINYEAHVHNNYDVTAQAYSGSGRKTVLQIRTIADGSVHATAVGGMFRFSGIVPWSTQIIDMEKMLGMEYLDPAEHAPVYLELEHVSGATAIGGPVRVHISDLVKPV